ncbi:MAG: DUF1573 domain-containing protein [Bacteroidaceae bacterium]|nr:DUF1573 domain-containing protein [Bacteroidaceae bacterium]MBO7260599.1 DUF1573 domain-containing protein [Bacteroidaceae bacterium]
MKRIILSAIALLMTASYSVYAQGSSNSKEPEITFEKTTHNFGIFDIENGLQKCEFVFKNTGAKDLVILSATASCGCTEPEYPKVLIAPGAQDTIRVTYDGTTRRPGVFRKVITLKTNAKVNTAYLYITGEMVEKMPAKPVE